MIRTAVRLAQQNVNSEQQAKATEENGTMKANLKHMRNGEKYYVKSIEYKAFVLEMTKLLLEEMTGISFSEMEDSKLFQDVFLSVMHTYCPQSTITCDGTSKYRTIDGSCNNIVNPEWGQSYSSKPRFMKPDYRNGVMLPRTTGVDGTQLPSARLISNVLMKSVGDPVYESNLTLMMVAWGQFLTHDMMLTPPTSVRTYFLLFSFQCFNIDVPRSDGYFNSTCMSFTRASPGPYRKCLLNGRDQINLQTSFIDSSNVYGSTPERSAELRTFAGGDDRVNVVPNLQGFHTLFLREHNRIAKALEAMNDHWTDEKIFQETRKIIGAIYQHVTYTQYLPNILNQKYLKDFQLTEMKDDIYNNTINPSIRNEFGAAAFRFGHSQVPRFMAYIFSNYTYAGKLDVKDLYGNPQIIEDSHGEHIPGFFRWLSWSRLYKTDRFLEDSVRNHLFFQKRRSFDLASINIQRGRDQGIPPYNKWRLLCGLSAANDFKTTDGGLGSQRYRPVCRRTKVRNPSNDGLVGPTFACIIARQFRDLKIGDRFWYGRQNVPIAFSKVE
ncbi:hypothetical protein KUTeg_008070 [Tegillarca granosa]|uniref:Peroxidase n=1 Tax=Tegillarca granosa TaxID=220873 RepID=A0ABQ9F815_TEGGR|nr:hypothetical protein KUTeg_008070 [Tegillarca granosa]